MENEALIMDLVEWVAERPRPYADVMMAWRTTCPRLTIWEDCLDGGYVRLAEGMVHATARGTRLLQQHGRGGAATAG